MNMKYTFNLIPLAVAMLLVSCHSEKQEDNSSNTEIIPVQVLPIRQQEITAEIPLAGKFTTDDETMLSFKTGGVIRSIAVDEGDFVRKGQVLATLDLTEINALVQQAELGLEKAKRDFERAERLYRDSVATREQFENAKTGVEVATEQARAAKFNGQYSVIRAMADGYVLLRMAEEGQLIGPGQPVLQVNGAGNGRWMFKAGVSDRDRMLIANGDKADITDDAGHRISATVIRRSEGVDPYSGTFTVYLAVSGNPKELASGLFGKGTLHASGKTTAWKVPYSAILDGDREQGNVFITNDEKKAELRPVKIHSINAGEALVTEGLENARALIVTGSAYLTNGSSIRVNR